jgi:hypothetical protein
MIKTAKRAGTNRLPLNPDQSVRTTEITLVATGFKPCPDPYAGDNQHYRMRGRCSALDPKLLDWMEVNPREQRLTGPIIRQIAETWEEYPTEFQRINRGILLFGQDLDYDGTTGQLRLRLRHKDRHGVGDGGHTLRLIVERLQPALATREEEADDNDNPDNDSPPRQVERYVEVEIFTGLGLEEISRIVRARNTSRNVPEYAVLNLQGTFDGLCNAIAAANPDYVTHCLACKPNEHIPDSADFKPVSLLQVLQLLTCMDLTHYPIAEDKHPVEAYKYRGKMDNFFVNRRLEYEKMYPIVGDILELWDVIRQRVPEAYNGRNRRWGKVIKEPVGAGLKERLYWLDPLNPDESGAVAPKAPLGLFLPMLGAFRAALVEEDGRYQWLGGQKPTRWLQEEFNDLLVKMALRIARAAREANGDFHAVGRDSSVWAACYYLVQSYTYESRRR